MFSFLLSTEYQEVTLSTLGECPLADVIANEFKGPSLLQKYPSDRMGANSLEGCLGILRGTFISGENYISQRLESTRGVIPFATVLSICALLHIS